MEFVRELEPWSAAHIAETLGCPERTVYSWKMGERLPPDWVQRLVIARLKKTRPTRR
jgi:DNA-binding transcriptional regulator YiaG